MTAYVPTHSEQRTGDTLFAVARAVLFEIDPEHAHDLALASLQRMAGGQWLRSRYTTVGEPYSTLGTTFPNRVGLAAGLDKNGDYMDALGALGFGCLEIGTVTPRPQPGNEKPRLFRLPNERALINRMGFNNLGVEHLAQRVEKRRYNGPLGINIGKNATTPLDEAATDYLACMERVFPLADYITVNVSSPNTRNLRDLQHGEHLHKLLDKLKTAQSRLATRHGRQTPLLIKIAPDLTSEEVSAFCSAAIEFELEGVITSNTTSDRQPIQQHVYARETGGLSGAPLKARADACLAAAAQQLGKRCTLIGVGGIDCGADAAEKIRLGAHLVQLYSGLIFHGPMLVRDCVSSVAAL